MLVITVILVTVLGLLIAEKYVVQKNVRNIPVRVHVNGTRGKSSVTEYIAAGIYSSGHNVMAKITGIIPTVIYNGTRRKIERRGAARVQEQIDTISLAKKRKVESLVLECMSISPELQKLESTLLSPHIYVITNIKDDHREAMGADINAQADAICNAIPKNSVVITAEDHFLNKIKEKAETRSCKVVSPPDIDPLLREKLPEGVFQENVALALAVCDEAGVDRTASEKGILEWISDTGSPLTTVGCNGKTIRFLNAFAVNDIESTTAFIEHYGHCSLSGGETMNVILNTRADRPLRTDMFAGWIAGSSVTGRVIVTGDHKRRAVHSLQKAGVGKEMIKKWPGTVKDSIKEYLVNSLDEGSLVVGLGNIGGDGFRVINAMR